MSGIERDGPDHSTGGAAQPEVVKVSPAELVRQGDDRKREGRPDLAVSLYKDALARDPKQLRAYQQLAGLALARGEIDEAIAFLDAGLARRPGSPALRHAKAKALRQAGRFADALDTIRSLLDQEPDLVILAAELERLDGKLDEAACRLRSLGFSVKGASGEAVRLARAYRDSKRTEDALALMREAFKACPQDRVILNTYVDILAAAGSAADPDEFETVMTRRLADEPSHLRTLLALSAHRADQGRIDEAFALLAQASTIHPHAPQPYLRRAALAREQNAEAALAVLDEGLDRLPLHEALAREKARILTTLSRDAEAEALLQAVLDEGEASEKFASALRLDLIAAIRRQGRLDEARERLGTDFARDADAREGLRLVNDLRAKGRTGDALEVIRLILESHPRDTNTLLTLAAILQRKEAFAEAEGVLRQILNIDPMHGRAYAALADIQGRTQSAAAATATLELGFSICVPTPGLYAMASAVHFYRGDAAQALQYLNEGLGQFPTDRNLLHQALDQSIAGGRFGDMAPWLAALPDTPLERSMRAVFRAKAALARLRFEEASLALDEAEQEDPTNHHVWIQRLLATMPRLRIEEARRAQRQLRALVREGDPDQVHAAHRVLGFYSEIFNDLVTDPAAMQAGREAVERNDLDRLCEVVRDFPDTTGLAIALVVALRGTGRIPGPRPGQKAPAAPIPRIVHQFWDAAEVPEDLHPFVDSWRTLNPDWTHRVYDMDSAQAFLAKEMPEPVRHAFHAARQAAHKADIFRLAVLLREGGVYADIDDRCTGPLDQLCAGATLVLRHENVGSIGNNFMACRPGHPLIAKALLGAVKATLEGHSEAIWLSTGPGLITRTFAQLYTTEMRTRAELEAQTRLLPDFVLRNFVASGLRAVYKSTAKHWVQQQFGSRGPSAAAGGGKNASEDSPVAPPIPAPVPLPTES